jgi:hypothetical protein
VPAAYRNLFYDNEARSQLHKNEAGSPLTAFVTGLH